MSSDKTAAWPVTDPLSPRFPALAISSDYTIIGEPNNRAFFVLTAKLSRCSARCLRLCSHLALPPQFGSFFQSSESHSIPPRALEFRGSLDSVFPDLCFF